MLNILLLSQTLFLTLDLSSHHGPLRPPRQRRHDPYEENEGPPTTTPTSDRIQVLGLHTTNPIVSYQNQIFSCSWADLIGTELLFTHPEHGGITSIPHQHRHHHPLRRDKNFDLIAANSVKVLGRRANLISSSGAGPGPASQENSTNTTALLSGLHSTEEAETQAQAQAAAAPPPQDFPHKPTTQTNQARFLERLMNLKQAQGETDTVRTVFNLKRDQNLENRLRGWARTEEQMAEIQRLNRAVLRGDADALIALQNIYAQVERSSQDGS